MKVFYCLIEEIPTYYGLAIESGLLKYENEQQLFWAKKKRSNDSKNIIGGLFYVNTKEIWITWFMK